MKIQIAHSVNDIAKCWKVLSFLRPNLAKEKFSDLIRTMIDEGYQLVFIEEDNHAVAAAGFRYLQNLYVGKHFYIDDLATLPEYRGKGYAGQLLDHITMEASRLGYAAVTLDSGYQRHDAHRFYLNRGFQLNCHHFLKQLPN